jgi:hypothetical protein
VDEYGLGGRRTVWLLGGAEAEDFEQPFPYTRYYTDPVLGNVLWVFTSPEEAERFVRRRVERRGLQESGFPGPAWETRRSGGLSGVGPLEAGRLGEVTSALDIDVVAVDAGSGNPLSRMHTVPGAAGNNPPPEPPGELPGGMRRGRGRRRRRSQEAEEEEG